MKKGLGILLLTVSIVMVLAGCGGGSAKAEGDQSAAPAKVYRLTYQTQQASGTPNYVLAEQLVKDVAKASNGQLILDLHPVGSIAGFNDIPNAVINGSLDCANVSTSTMSGLLGQKAYLFGGSGSPGGFNPDEFLAWTYAGGGEETMRKYIEPFGLKFLTMSIVSGAELFCHSDKPLESIEDFKGLKFRTLGMWADILNQLGASVVNVGGGDIYQAAEKGLIDAFEYCDAAMNYDMGFSEIKDWIGVPGIHSPTCGYAFLVNPDTWATIPEHLQEILYQCVKAQALVSPLYFTVVDGYAIEKFKEDGVQVFTLSEETQREILDITYELQKQYMKEDPLFEEVFMDQKQFLANYKKTWDLQQITMSTYDDEYNY